MQSEKNGNLILATLIPSSLQARSATGFHPERPQVSTLGGIILGVWDIVEVLIC